MPAQVIFTVRLHEPRLLSNILRQVFQINQSEDELRTMKWLQINSRWPVHTVKRLMCLEPSTPLKSCSQNFVCLALVRVVAL